MTCTTSAIRHNLMQSNEDHIAIFEFDRETLLLPKDALGTSGSPNHGSDAHVPPSLVRKHPSDLPDRYLLAIHDVIQPESALSSDTLAAELDGRVICLRVRRRR